MSQPSDLDGFLLLFFSCGLEMMFTVNYMHTKQKHKTICKE